MNGNALHVVRPVYQFNSRTCRSVKLERIKKAHFSLLSHLTYDTESPWKAFQLPGNRLVRVEADPVDATSRLCAGRNVNQESVCFHGYRCEWKEETLAERTGKRAFWTVNQVVRFCSRKSKKFCFTLTDDLLVTQSSDCDSGTCTMPEGNMEEELKEMQSDGKLCVTFSMDDSTDNEAVTCSKNG